MKKIYFILILITFTISCSEHMGDLGENQNYDDPVTKHYKTNKIKDIHSRDLNEIKKDGILRAITIFSSTSYFLYKGELMGFDYELLESLAKSLGLTLDIVTAKDINELFLMLNRGDGDIVAYGMTITKPREEIVNFTNYHFLTHQVLVQRKPDNWREMKLHQINKKLVTNPIDLIGDTVAVRARSSYFQRLKNLSSEIGGTIHIDTSNGGISTEDIIKMVADKKIKFTVADNNIALINSSYHPELDINTQISFSQRIAWAIRKNNPLLLNEVNKWMDSVKKDINYQIIYNKYFKNTKSYKKRIKSEFYSLKSLEISQYDNLIKKYSSQMGWDWRLVSSLVYQESQFDPNSESWVNARGLMQLMPQTAKELGVNDITDPEDNLRGGIKYLKQLWNWWSDIPDSLERIKFVLASYNCGYHHVVDARELARKYDKNPNLWDDHIDEYLLKLSHPEYYHDEVVRYGYLRGTETYNYVRDIFDRYRHYKNFIPL